MATHPKILVIDDEEAICFAFQRYFEPRGCRVRLASTAAAGMAAYAEGPADVVFLDVRLPDGDGLDVLARLCDRDPHARVVIITAHGSLETVTRAIQGRAFDYLVKPIDLDRAAELVSQAMASRQAAASPVHCTGMEGETTESVAQPPSAVQMPGNSQPGAAVPHVTLVGRSPAIQEVYKRIGRVAGSDSAVLIVGRTGTGKELVARAIHEHSPRRAGPFVAVNCGALPESLVESELFGYARGAFTGAAADKPGRFEAADGGTLFFDEVGELPTAAQVKVLRFLDTQAVERLGSVESVRLSVRVLAATNRDLASAMEAGRFREDLYYRLAVIQIVLPPLAARTEDILPLAHHFLARHTPPGRKPPVLSREAADALVACAWPGNVRELRNAVEHAVTASGGGPILAAHLPESVRRAAATPRSRGPARQGETPHGPASLGEAPRSPAGQGEAPRSPADLDAAIRAFLDAAAASAPYREILDRTEEAIIRRALAEAGGNQSLAAERLGLHRNTLRNKLRDLGIDA